MLALDARVTLHPPDLREDRLPGWLSGPYPAQYGGVWEMNVSGQVAIRPIRPEDEPLMVRFHGQLSGHPVRDFHPMGLDQRVSHERRARICFIDYDHEMPVRLWESAGW